MQLETGNRLRATATGARVTLLPGVVAAAIALVIAVSVASFVLYQANASLGDRGSGRTRIEALSASEGSAAVAVTAPGGVSETRTAPAPTTSSPAISPPLLISNAEHEGDGGGNHLRVPYRSQFDGSTFEWGNCGVSAISMAMEFYGVTVSTHEVRLSINQKTGNWDTKIGVDWRYLKQALEERGFRVNGPYAPRSGYLTWTLDEVMAEVEQGRPVMLLVHYRTLPGHEEDEWIGDHYILVLGRAPNGDIIYHDPGFPGDEGAYMKIDQERLERAWSKTWIGQNRTAMVILDRS